MWRRFIKFKTEDPYCQLRSENNNVFYSLVHPDIVHVEVYLMNSSIIQPANKLRRTMANTASAGSSSSSFEYEDDGATALYWTIYVVLLICIILVIMKTIFLSTCEDDHECNRRFNIIICLNGTGCTGCYCTCCINETYQDVSDSNEDSCDCNECCLRCADGVCAGLCNACWNVLCECLLNAIFSC